LERGVQDAGISSSPPFPPIFFFFFFTMGGGGIYLEGEDIIMTTIHPFDD
jgi:hypothetical protein